MPLHYIPGKVCPRGHGVVLAGSASWCNVCGAPYSYDALKDAPRVPEGQRQGDSPGGD